METLITDSDKLKELVKQAIIEAMEEKKDLVHDLILEVMEDLAMINAIKEGENTDSVSRNEVFRVLDSST